MKSPQMFVPARSIAPGSGLVPGAPAEKIPKLLLWMLLGLSALILLIQIWIYLT
jgi:hypothetical protein